MLGPNRNVRMKKSCLALRVVMVPDHSQLTHAQGTPGQAPDQVCQPGSPSHCFPEVLPHSTALLAVRCWQSCAGHLQTASASHAALNAVRTTYGGSPTVPRMHPGKPLMPACMRLLHS